MSAPLDAYSGMAIYLDTMLPYDLLRGVLLQISQPVDLP